MSDTIQILNLFISEGHDFKGRFGKGRLNHGASSVDTVECVAGRGLVGDRYFDFVDDYKGQLSLIALEDIRALEADLGLEVADFRAFRRNAVVSGVDLRELVGKAFRLGEVELLGVEQCKPCFWMDESIGAGAHEALLNRGGLRCRILSSGSLRTGVASLELIV